MDMVNVDFEWFDPQPEVDFHGLKTLLRQLLDVDSQLFDLSELTDLILSQPLLGSTVKVDGNETDPYAFLSVLNLETHKVLTLQTPVLEHRKLIPPTGQESNPTPNNLPNPKIVRSPHPHSITRPNIPRANRPHPLRTLHKHAP
jgi:hypothetical protein